MASTYKKVLDAVIQAGLRKATIALSTKVTEIVSDSAADGPGTVRISTENGEQQIFDAIVTTTPLGYLKRNLHAFRPPLPAHLQASIAHISYGRLEKVYLTFSEPFWLLEDNPSPFFMHFIHPMYAPNVNPGNWSVECVSLASLPEPYRHPTLLFYLHGPSAEHITSLINGRSLEDPMYLQLLDGFFRPYYSRLPNHIGQCPTAALATNWQNDEFAGYGSYTNFQVAPAVEDGGEEILLDKDIEILRHGAPERSIWFAGEHTAPFVALGTVTGAYWSGEAVARRILETYSLQEDKSTMFEGEGLKAGEQNIGGTGLGGGLVGL